MKIQRIAIIGLLEAIGFSKAAEWDTAKLLERASMLPEKVAPEQFNEYKDAGKYRDVYDQIVAAKGKIEIVEGTEKDKEEKKDVKKEEKKPAKPAAKAKTAPAANGNGKKPAPAKVAEKKDKPKAAAKPAKPAKEKKKDETPRDEWGCAEGSIRYKVNKQFSDDWQSDDDIAKGAGVKIKQARIRLRRAARGGILEVRHRIEYRLKAKKK